MLELRTNQLKTRHNVKIDEHVYTVRKMGNIEQLDLSQYFRRLKVLADKEISSPLSDSESKEVEQLTINITNLFVGLFDDGENQEKSRKLVSSLSDTEIGLLLAQIFEETNETNS